MSASGQTHAEAIGLTGYATDASGIGGLVKPGSKISVLRNSPPNSAWISVVDSPSRASPSQLGDQPLHRPIGQGPWHPKERIFFAGTKDKRAITRQLFVIDAPANKVSGVELTDVDIEVLGRTHQKIGLVITEATGSRSRCAAAHTRTGVQ